MIACHECDLLLREPVLTPGSTASCLRCGAVLRRKKHDSFDRTIAFLLGAAVLFVVANVFPLVAMEAGGNRTVATLFGAARALHEEGSSLVAGLVLLTAIVMPALEIAVMLYMMLPLRLGRLPPGLGASFRLVQAVRPWGMVEVFMLGILCSVVKLTHLASIVPGIALWSFGVLIVLLAAAASSFDPHELWARAEAASKRASRAGVPGAGGVPA